MDAREKLVELMTEFYGCDPMYYNVDAFAIADHLVTNGVTVQEWIPVTERLPEEGEYALCVLKGFSYGGKIQFCKFVPADKYKDKPYFKHFRNGFPFVTHWMPLPLAPEDMK